MVTRRDYTAEAVEAAKSVLIELMHLLGEYRDDIVLRWINFHGFIRNPKW